MKKFSGLENTLSLLSINNLSVSFHTRHGIVRAVDSVSLTVDTNEMLGIVGESGSGKTVLCQSIMGLVECPPGQVTSGTMEFDGSELAGHPQSLRRVRGKSMTMIFQDPMTALNPYMTIGAQLVEPLRIHNQLTQRECRVKALELLSAVGISDPLRRLGQYPHEFSGGMRQRVCIAMALITGPKLVFADEPTTALDVTIQAHILALLKHIQMTTGISVVLVTHDFGVVAGVCSKILVMYAGRVVESGSTASIFNTTLHPYTHALLRALPARAQPGQKLYSIPGQPPDPLKSISGCPFAPRCEFCIQLCREQTPELVSIDGAHASACLRVQRGELRPLVSATAAKEGAA